MQYKAMRAAIGPEVVLQSDISESLLHIVGLANPTLSPAAVER